MKNKIIALLIIAMAVIMSVSCTPQFSELDTDDTSSVKIQTKGAEPEGEVSWRQRLHDIQSCPAVILRNHMVRQKEGGYKMVLSKEECKDLGISEKEYDNFQSLIKELNSDDDR